MEPSVIVDTSVLVAFYREEDSLHESAVMAMNNLKRNKLTLHPYIIQETISVLTYKSGCTLAKKFSEDILVSEEVFIPLVMVSEEIAYFKKLNKKISFADSTLLYLSEKSGNPILTFDQQILALANTLSN